MRESENLTDLKSDLNTLSKLNKDEVIFRNTVLTKQYKKANFDNFKPFTVTLFDGDDEIIARIFADKSYNFNAVQELYLGGNGIGTAGLQALASSENLKNVTTLDITQNQIGGTGAQALANSENLKNLRNLYLCWNQIGDIGAQALANSENLKNVDTNL